MKNMNIRKVRFHDDECGYDVHMVIRYGLLPPGDGVPAYFSVLCRCYKIGEKAMPYGTVKETKSVFLDLSVNNNWREKACGLCPDLVDIIRLHGCDIKGKPLTCDRDVLALLGLARHDVAGRKRYTRLVAKTLRIPQIEAVRIVKESLAERFGSKELDRYILKQAPRWKKEADAVIKKYGFEV